MMRQEYKEAIYYFREHPEEIEIAWRRPFQHPHGRLFQFCSPDGHWHRGEGFSVGCPLMVARSGGGGSTAWTPELTERCRRELKNTIDKITDEELQALGHLQSDMDQTIRDPEWRKLHRYSMYEWARDPEVMAGLRENTELPDDDEEDD